jgi:hypothetical protein
MGQTAANHQAVPDETNQAHVSEARNKSAAGEIGHDFMVGEQREQYQEGVQHVRFLP